MNQDRGNETFLSPTFWMAVAVHLFLLSALRAGIFSSFVVCKADLANEAWPAHTFGENNTHFIDDL